MLDRNKFDLGANLQTMADSRVQQAFELFGKALPVSVVEAKGAIVTCQFEVFTDAFALPKVTVPVGISRYVRLPIQKGDKGFVVPCDVPLGGIDGLGLGTAALDAGANLTSLVFFPIGHAQWPSVDPKAVVQTAPNGVELRDDSNASNFKLTPSGITITTSQLTLTISDNGTITCADTLTLKAPAITLDGNVTISGSLSQGTGSNGGTATMAGPVTVTGDLKANGISVSAHIHPIPGGTTGEPQS